MSYDLHIHSCLSPCGDDTMTPNNIVNMCALKGLDVIAVTDHNHCGNVPPVYALARAQGIICIPGMEVQTREEVHVLCYFETIEKMQSFFDIFDTYRLRLPNRPDYFGEQYFMDIEDVIVDTYAHTLITSMDLSFEALIALVKQYDGIAIPAHVNKGSNSILANLGFMPKTADINTVEVFKGAPLPDGIFDHYVQLFNSDAHALAAISEPEHFIEVDEKNITAVFKCLRGA
nr:PHP domain-containing protein [Fusibacter paucivorans]